MADDPRHPVQAVGGYTTVLPSLIDAPTVWQIGILRTGAWTTRACTSPPAASCWPDIGPDSVYGCR